MRVSNPMSVKYLWKTYFAYYCLQIILLCSTQSLLLAIQKSRTVLSDETTYSRYTMI